MLMLTFLALPIHMKVDHIIRIANTSYHGSEHGLILMTYKLECEFSLYYSTGRNSLL